MYWHKPLVYLVRDYRRKGQFKEATEKEGGRLPSLNNMWDSCREWLGPETGWVVEAGTCRP